MYLGTLDNWYGSQPPPVICNGTALGTLNWWYVAAPSPVGYVASGAAGLVNLKTMQGLAKANVKTVHGLAIASVKSVHGLT
jgi:hypothetical protein